MTEFGPNSVRIFGRPGRARARWLGALGARSIDSARHVPETSQNRSALTRAIARPMKKELDGQKLDAKKIHAWIHVESCAEFAIRTEFGERIRSARGHSEFGPNSVTTPNRLAPTPNRIPNGTERAPNREFGPEYSVPKIRSLLSG